MTLGRTVAEIDHMSVSEFCHWIALDGVYPAPDSRNEFQLAQLTSALIAINSNSKRKLPSTSDLMLSEMMTKEQRKKRDKQKDLNDQFRMVYEQLKPFAASKDNAGKD